VTGGDIHSSPAIGPRILPGMDREKRRDPVAGTDRPRVIVDFEVEQDTLLVAVRNIGTRPAAHVRVSFEPSFRGLGGVVDIPRLKLFSRLAFLAPDRTIRALVDTLDAYLGRTGPAEPRAIVATILYRDGAGRRFRARTRHDLSIWEDLPRLGQTNTDGRA
jgi:hypothetical protein